MRCLVTKKQSQIALGWLSLYRSTNAPGAFFSVAVISEVGDVACTLFWTDCWLHGQRICGLVPQLFTLVAYRRSNKRTVLGGGSYPRCSICWCYCQIPWALGHSLWGGFATWGRRLIYAVFQYLAITRRSLLTGAYFRVRWHGPWDRIWKSWAPGNCNSFMWLMAHDKCWTADRITRCGLPHPEPYPHCDQETEIPLAYLLCLCSGFLV